MADSFPSLDAADVDVMYEALGETITYNGESVVSVHNVMYRQVGRDSSAIEDRHTFNLRYADVSSPSRGDVIWHGSYQYTVDSVLRIDAIEFMVMTH